MNVGIRSAGNRAVNAISDAPGGTVLLVRVVPNASRNEVAEMGADVVRIRLQAPPVEGKANKALVEFLAGTLGIRPREIAIAGGEHSRHKRVLVAGLPAPEVSRRLAAG